MENQPIQQNMEAASNNIEQGYNNVKNSISQGLESFSEKINENAEASSSFLSSNTIVAKFAFIVLIIIVFVILLNLGIILLSKATGPSTNPFLINGLISGSSSRTITQDPGNRSSVPIKRSNNESEGLEFTYSVWLYVDDIGQTGSNTLLYKHIFNKGDKQYDETTGIAINNGPGVYLEAPESSVSPEQAKILVVMDSYKGKNEIEIDDFPIKKWVCLIIRAQNTAIDVYVNGSIAQRLIMDEVPKQNYYDMNVAQNGGFTGNISSLRYYERALNIFEIKQLLEKGPNMSNDLTSGSYFNYLSNLWYSSKF